MSDSTDAERRENDVRDIVPLQGTRVYCVRAGMAMGKTQASIKLVREYVEAGKRVLIVSSRRAFAAFQKGVYSEFDFTHYSDVKKGGQMKNVDRLICQYESLTKLMWSERFDLVVLDEIRSICACMTSIATNQKGATLKSNANILKLLVSKSNLTLCLDADLEYDASVPAFLQECVPAETIEVHTYTQQRIQRKLVLTEDSEKFLKDIDDAVISGKRVGILCRTKRMAKVYYMRYKELWHLDQLQFKDRDDKTLSEERWEMGRPTFEDTVGVLYTGDSDDMQSKKFEDVNTYLADKKLFVFTSKLTTGMDIQVEWDILFVDFLSRGCLARDMLQMIGRFRRLKNNTIQVLVPDIECKDKELRWQADEYFKSRSSLTQQLQGILRNNVEFVEGKGLQWAHDWMLELFILAYVEFHNDQVWLLCATAKSKGWEVQAQVTGYSMREKRKFEKDSESKEKKQMAAFGSLPDDVKDAKNQQFDNCFEVVKENQYELGKIIKEKSVYVSEQVAKHDDRVILSIAHVFKHYDKPGKGIIDTKMMSKAMKKDAIIRRHALLTKTADWPVADIIKELSGRVIRRAKKGGDNFDNIAGDFLLIQYQKTLDLLQLIHPLPGQGLAAYIGVTLSKKDISAHDETVERVSQELRVSSNMVATSTKKPSKRKREETKEMSDEVVLLRGMISTIWGLTLERRRVRTGRGARSSGGHVIEVKAPIAQLAEMSNYQEGGEHAVDFGEPPAEQDAHASYGAGFQQALAALRARSLSVDNGRV